MELKNTTLDDLAAVIGFTPTLRLAAWFGGRGNLYIPDKCEEGQLLVKLIGMSAAKKLTEEWGLEHIAVPRLSAYEEDERKRNIGWLLERGATTREISRQMLMSERRVQQICRELEVAGLIQIVTPKTASNFDRRKAPRTGAKNAGENALENGGGLAPEFFGRSKK